MSTVSVFSRLTAVSIHSLTPSLVSALVSWYNMPRLWATSLITSMGIHRSPPSTVLLRSEASTNFNKTFIYKYSFEKLLQFQCSMVAAAITFSIPFTFVCCHIMFGKKRQAVIFFQLLFDFNNTRQT